MRSPNAWRRADQKSINVIVIMMEDMTTSVRLREGHRKELDSSVRPAWCTNTAARLFLGGSVFKINRVSCALLCRDLLVLILQPIPQARAQSEASLSLSAIQKVISRPDSLHANFGIEFLFARHRKIVYALNADKLCPPPPHEKSLRKALSSPNWAPTTASIHASIAPVQSI